MDVLTLAATCGAGVDPVTTAAIVKLESGYEPLVIRDNTLKVTLHAASRDQAVAMVDTLTRRGHQLAIGLMQVTTPWAVRLHLPPTELLEACTNIAVGTWILKQNYARCGASSGTEQGLSCALSTYWSGNGRIGGVYVNAVYAGAHSAVRVSETPGISDGLLGREPVRLALPEGIGHAGHGFDFGHR